MSEKVDLLINRHLWSEFTTISLGLHIDSVATMTFTSPWDPLRQDMRDAFRPYDYQPLDCLIADELQFVGNIITPSPSSDPKKAEITANGYALCGRLQDCKVPPTSYPLEFSKQKIDVIARKICVAMGLDVEIEDVDLGAPFERSVLKPTDDPWGFLVELAKQRNLLLSSTSNGHLLIHSVVESDAVASFERGKPPMVSNEAKFDGQSYHSEYTALGTAKLGVKGGKNTVQNPRLTTIQRAEVFEADKSEKGDLPKAAQAKFGRVLAAAGGWQIKVPTWRDAKKKLWRPGTFVNVTDPHAMIFQRTKLLIRNVKLNQSGKDDHAILDVVLKESFTDQQPGAYPWA